MSQQIQEKAYGRIITANHHGKVNNVNKIVPANIVLTLNVDENPGIEKVQDILSNFCDYHNIVESFTRYETERVNARQIRYIVE